MFLFLKANPRRKISRQSILVGMTNKELDHQGFVTQGVDLAAISNLHNRYRYKKGFKREKTFLSHPRSTNRKTNRQLINNSVCSTFFCGIVNRQPPGCDDREIYLLAEFLPSHLATKGNTNNAEASTSSIFSGYRIHFVSIWG